MATTPGAKAAEEQRTQERLLSAYRALFGGDPAKRSEVQRLVWEDLQKVGYARQPVFVPDREGRLCPLKAAIAEGRRSTLLYIEANVEAGAPTFI